MIIGKKLQELRKGKNISQKEVASAVGISQAAYSYFESGDKIPSLAMTKAFARFFDVSLDELAGN